MDQLSFSHFHTHRGWKTWSGTAGPWGYGEQITDSAVTDADSDGTGAGDAGIARTRVTNKTAGGKSFKLILVYLFMNVCVQNVCVCVFT